MTKLSDYLSKYMYGSACAVELSIRHGGLRRVKIEFSGPAANIPSLKNSKIPGKNFVNPSTMARIRLMDYLYENSLKKCQIPAPITFGQLPVALMLICAKRKVHFDTDNCLATVRDWLEPKTKKVGKGKQRGWGIGIVENDRQIRGFAVYDKDLGLDLKKSILIIQPYDGAKERLAEFVQSVFFDISDGDIKYLVN